MEQITKKELAPTWETGSRHKNKPIFKFLKPIDTNN